jgi:hypothetical protein
MKKRRRRQEWVSRIKRRRKLQLLDEADRLLIADAKRRHGKRFSKRVKDQIAAGRYGAAR